MANAMPAEDFVLPTPQSAVGWLETRDREERTGALPEGNRPRFGHVHDPSEKLINRRASRRIDQAEAANHYL